MDQRLERIAVLGLGLLGGSIGLAVKQRKLADKVVGWSHRDQTRGRALSSGAVDDVVDSPARAVERADLVIICTPVGAVVPTMKAIVDSIGDNTIVTDVGSTKASIVAAGEEIIGGRFVGSHPMAGGENAGIEHARVDLFESHVCLLTPTARTRPEALDRANRFWHGLGMKTKPLLPEEHDRKLALVSHLPHVLAAALVQVQDDDFANLCGNGFKDMTRIAAGDPALWRDILLDNQLPAINAIDRLIAELDRLKSAIDQRDERRIIDMLQAAQTRRRSM